MKRRNVWLIAIIVVVVLIAGGYFLVNNRGIGQERPDTSTGSATTSTDRGSQPQAGGDDSSESAVDSTVPIMPASTIIGQVSAAGNIELVSQQNVAVEVDGVAREIAVKAGDRVEAGALLLSLDSVELERAVRRAELDVESAGNQVAQLTEEAGAADIAMARAQVAEARENLLDVMAGPSEAETAAAEAKVLSANANYDELLAGASDARLTQLRADLRKKEVAMQLAQGDYDEISWRSDASATSQAASLQDATIDYEAALAAFEEETAPASISDVQSALSAAQEAVHALAELLNSPTPAQIATAQAQVADAEAELENLLQGPSETELREVQIALEKALVDLEEAHSDLLKAKVVTPISGVVLAVDAEAGQRFSRGTVVAAIADPALLELTVDVAEVDIPQVALGQSAEIGIDAFPGKVFDGVVDVVSPAGDLSSGLVNYPVTVRLTGNSLDGVLPGMTAVATLKNSEAARGWLVPTNAIRQQGDGAVVLVVRGDERTPVEVSPGLTQGEWTVVQTPELREGDAVVGSTTSFIGEDDGGFGPGRGGPPGGGGGGPFRPNN